MHTPPSLDTLFLQARSFSRWQARELSEAQIHELYEVLRWGPSSANCSPARFVFVRSAAAKARLLPCLDAGNRDKVAQAPLTVIIGMDLRFHEQLPRLFPHADARSWFEGQDAKIAATAFRNSSLQGAYLMLAARALGLDVGPMSGFDAAAVEAAFFVNSSVKANFICSIGYGDRAALHPRLPRLSFDEACQIV